LASALTATLFVSGGEVFAQANSKAPKETASFAALRSATPEEARTQAEAWLKSVGKTDAATQTAFDAIWKGDGSVLDKVADTLTLGDHEARALLAEARNNDASPPTAVPALLKDTKRPIFYRANLTLAYAQALSMRRVYEEALEALNGVKVGQVVDPAAYLFHKAVAEHGLLKGAEASKTCLRLIDDVDDAPERYKSVAALMVFDILQWKEKDVGMIARQMDVSGRRLDLTRGGPDTQKLQREIVLRLDELIKELENNPPPPPPGNDPGPPGPPNPGPNNTTNPTRPQDDSNGGEGSGPGNVNDMKIKNLAALWGKLPERDRARAMMDLTRDMSPRYRRLVQKYFEELSKESGNMK
jgi:hypothetical protein